MSQYVANMFVIVTQAMFAMEDQQNTQEPEGKTNHYTGVKFIKIITSLIAYRFPKYLVTNLVTYSSPYLVIHQIG